MHAAIATSQAIFRRMDMPAGQLALPFFFFFFFGLSLPPSNMKILANFVCVWTASWVHPCTIYNIYNLFTKYLQTYFTGKYD